ncbi:ATP synthase subunit s, mitochondrial [Aphelenchoides bicaudatus]|nr:ATP synthase subunit s, mitochondrial [Aphelenchoides bicaudatus]
MSRHLIRFGDQLKNAIASHNVPGLKWLIDGFNYYDIQRVREVGADRACAEWVVRCGGSVKFDKFKDTFNDYNTLIRVTAELDPAKPSGQVSIVNIDASNSCVSGFGCRHLNGLKGLETLTFARCKNLQDFALETVGNEVGSTLSHLKLEACPRITEFGLKHLKTFTGLKTLTIKDLPRVYKPERSKQEIEKALPNCQIDFPTK